jgi:prolyl 4-hydroxylase
MFTTNGSPIFSIDSLLYHETAIIHTNGHWIWPGVKIGFEQYTFEGIKLTTLSVRPLVHRVHELLTYEECDLIQTLASPYMINSKTSKMDKDVNLPDTAWRTSTQYFLPSKHQTIIDIDYRVASLTKSRLSQHEYVQVLRYEKTQQYKHHTDYFDITQYQTDAEVLKMLKGGEVNRLITVFWYLSNVTRGGHTIFPQANGGYGGYDTGDCDIPTALKVQPVKGEAIIFYSLNSDGSVDPKSVHGGCPVIEGTKWSANKWIWYKLIIKNNNIEF